MATSNVDLFDEVVEIDSADAKHVRVSKAGSGMPRKGRFEATARFFRSLGPVYSLGCILAHVLSSGKTVADLIVANQDKSFTGFKGFKAAGSFVAVPGFKIGMQNFSQWACVVCGSAHGSGVGSSGNSENGLNALKLSTNEFYFAPKVGRVFIMSKTCKEKWFDGRFTIATEPYKSKS